MNLAFEDCWLMDRELVGDGTGLDDGQMDDGTGLDDG
jgi:hypothetical protein